MGTSVALFMRRASIAGSLFAGALAFAQLAGGGGASPAQAKSNATTTTTTAAVDVDAGSASDKADDRTWCERRFVAPLLTYASTRTVREWSPPSESKATNTATNVYCSTCADAGAVAPDASVAEAGAAKRDAVAVRTPNDDVMAHECTGFGEKQARRLPADSRKRSLSSKRYISDLEEVGYALLPDEIDVRIATIPDPTDSSLQHYFDMVVESLQLAIERDGYARDQSWLPWSDTQATDDATRSASEGCRRETPGVIVFRRTNGAAPGRAETIVLLLVGETPVYGIQKGSFAKAIDFHRRFARHKPLRIVGPTFSGSAHSLRQTLNEEWECSARIVSGSATSRAAAELLRGEDPDSSTESEQTSDAGTPPEQKRDARIQFELTTIPEDELQCALFRHLWFIQNWWRREAVADEEVQGLALLRESGTAFGASETTEKPRDEAERKKRVAGWFHCQFEPALDIRFPHHISSVRDAYEELDEDHSTSAKHEAVQVRHTSLDMSLKERAKSRDMQAETSAKAPAARDLVLTQLLSGIARQNIRNVAIQATDSADVIFLARKIRAVAPDVRLIIFGNDVLYTHPSLRPDLVGSLIVTPYPFFGANDFSGLTQEQKDRLRNDSRPLPPEDHLPFASALSEGEFNAALAVGRESDAGTEGLAEYQFRFEKGDHSEKAAPPLPLWIAAIGADGVVPVAVRRPPDCGKLVFGRERKRENEERWLCDEVRTDTSWSRAVRRQLSFKTYSLHIDPDITPPNFWQFLFATLMLISFIDAVRGRSAIRAMVQPSTDERRGILSDQQLDVATILAKHRFYAALRRLILFFSLVAMLVVQSLAITTYGRDPFARKFPVVLLVIGAASTILTGMGVWTSWRRLFFWRKVLRRQLRKVPEPDTKHREAPVVPRTLHATWKPIALLLGFNPTRSRRAIISHTLNQLRFLAVLAVIASAVLGVLFLKEVEELDPAFGSVVAIQRDSNPDVAMFVLRALPLVNRVSPTMPLLLSLLCCFIWACGRSRRLRELHSIAAMTPPAGARHAVCVPISYVMHDLSVADAGESLVDAERRLADAVVRPSHSPFYFFAMFAAAFFPVVAFTLKPPTTLESWELTIVLISLLAICAFVVIATVVQLGLYWRSFARLLDRIQNHPLAESFDDIPGPLKESIDSQVSHDRDDGHRFASCVRRFEELVDTRASVVGGLPDKLRGGDLKRLLKKLQAALVDLLTAREKSLSGEAEDHAAKLGRLLIIAAATIRDGLDEIWAAKAERWRKGKIGAIRPAKDGEPHDKAPRVDAMSRFDGEEEEGFADVVAWLRRAHSFVAAVVTLVLNRHVRQFRVFLYTSTGAALALLAALASYSFQPRRLLLTCIWIIMGAVVTTCAYVYVQLDRNALLSRISGTKPGRLELNASFAARVVGWMAFPLLSVAAAQYPEVAQRFFAWMEPFLNALK